MEVSTLLVGWGWTYEQLRAGWQEIEALGFDACYIGDDLFPHHFDVDPANAEAQIEVYDPWTIMPVMAETTERMRIGSLVSPAGRRHPALFAKMTSIVDVISNGRLSVGLGSGNAPDQAHALGEPYLKASQRVAKLEEEVRILDSVWRNERTNFDGEYYTANKLVSFPKPVSQPRPEIQIAFKSKKFLTRLAAEFADRVNLLGNDEAGVQAALDALQQHCTDLGTDYDRIRKGRLCSVIFTDDEVGPDERENVLRERAVQLNREPDGLIYEHHQSDFLLSYVGPPDKCVETFRERNVPLGIDELVICPDTAGENSYENVMKGLRFIASEIMPGLKNL